MQKRSLRQLPVYYRPYDFPAGAPIPAFLGELRAVSRQAEFLHFHNCLEIGKCLQGRGAVYTGGEEALPCQAGDYCLIAPQTEHMLTCDGEPCLWEFLYVETSSLPDAAGLRFPGLSVVGDGEPDDGLALCLSLLFQEFHQRQPFCREAAHGLLLSLLWRYSRRTLPENASLSEEKSGVSHVRAALSCIEEQCHRPLTVAGIAESCRISPGHLRKLFKAAVGIGPLEYLQRCRIRRACRLIHQNAYPISEIAGMVGYTSLTSFNRQFLRYTRLSPSAWKKAQLSAPRQNEALSPQDRGTAHIF